MRKLRVRTLLAVSGLAVSIPSVAHATDYTYVGPSGCPSPPCSGMWSDPKNWSPNGVPSTDDTATISGAPGGTTVTIGNVTVRELTINAKVSLGGSTGCTAALASTASGPATFTWNGGALACTVSIPANGTATLANGDKVLNLGGDLKNAGTMTWTGGRILGGGGGVLENSGTFTVMTDAGFGYSVGTNTATFVNSGTFVYANGGTLVFDGSCWGLHTTGTVRVLGGAIELRSAGNEQHVLGDGAIFDGAGKTVFTEPGFMVGVASSTSSMSVGGTITLNAGATVELGYGAVVAGQGALIGPGTIEWSGAELTSDFSGKTISIGKTTSLAIDGDQLKVIDGGLTLDSQGAITWTGMGSIGGTDGATIINRGTFVATNDESFAYGFGGTNSATFQNVGTFTKMGGTAETVFTDAWSFANTGVVDVETGTLHLESAGNGGHQLQDGGHFKGPGKTKIGADTTMQNPPPVAVLVAGTTSVDLGGTLEIATGSSVSGAATFAGPGTLVWSGGTLHGNFGTDAITFAKDLVVSLQGADAKSLTDGGKLAMLGTTTWKDAGALMIDNGSVQNGGSFVAASDATIDLNSSGSTFANDGTFTKNGGTGTTIVRPDFTNGGTVDVKTGTLVFRAGYAQAQGTTRVSGATLAAKTSAGDKRMLSLDGGTLEGTGTVDADLTIGGTVFPGGDGKPGKLAVTGTYTQAKTATIGLDIGGKTAGTDFDLLAVGDAAMLDGTIKASLASGYVPSEGDSFEVITFKSGAGTFATVAAPANVSLTPTYDPGDVKLGVSHVGSGGASGGAGGSATGGSSAGGSAAGGAAHAGSGGTSASGGKAGSTSSGGKGGATTGGGGASGTSATPPIADNGGDSGESGGGCSIATNDRRESGLLVALGLGLVLVARRRR